MSDALLSCQRDAHAREATVNVLRCIADDDHWWVTTDDSVLYPEGGGQPSDHGVLGGERVSAVRRDRLGRPEHRVRGPVPLGPARVVVDWPRRFDHMQQHTAQHLLSALLESMAGCRTTSFHLGRHDCSIDLDEMPDHAQVLDVVEAANAAVRRGLAVGARVLDPADDPDGVRSRGLPEGHTGPVRVIEIPGIDSNTCGGTHVSNLSALQAIAVPRIERHRGGAKLHFVAGQRLIGRAALQAEREQALGELLRVAPDELVNAVERLIAGRKADGKALRAAREERAELLGQALAAGGENPVVAAYPDANAGELGRIVGVAKGARPGLCLVVSGSGGSFVVAGPEAWVAEAGPVVAGAMGGRGGGRGERFQGKGSRALDAATLILPPVP